VLQLLLIKKRGHSHPTQPNPIHGWIQSMSYNSAADHSEMFRVPQVRISTLICVTILHTWIANEFLCKATHLISFLILLAYLSRTVSAVIANSERYFWWKLWLAFAGKNWRSRGKQIAD